MYRFPMTNAKQMVMLIRHHHSVSKYLLSDLLSASWALHAQKINLVIEVFIKFAVSVSKSHSLTVDIVEDEWYCMLYGNVTPSLDLVLVNI